MENMDPAQQEEQLRRQAARDKLRERFEPAYLKWKEGKSTLGVKSDEQYDDIVSAFRKKNFKQKLTSKEHNWTNRFECELQNGREILKNKGKLVVKESNLFDLLFDVHVNLGHSGRDGMDKELKKDFDGISNELLTVFVKCCEECEMKKGHIKKGVTVHPILSDDQNSRCQADLIDYQTKRDGEYGFIMVYQDHLTKFVILRPLKRKTGEAVAEQLVEIFANRRYHSAIKQSPFEAMFGRSAFQIGNVLHSDNVNDNADDNTSDSEGAKESSNDSNEAAATDIDELRSETDVAEDEERTLIAAEGEELSDAFETEESLSFLKEQQSKNRQTAREGMQQQAEKMVEMSSKRYKPLEVGDNVRIPVPDVDRAKTDPRNVLGIITEVKDGFYKVATRQGHLPRFYARNQLQPTSQNFIQFSDVPEENVRSVRTVAVEESISSGQGMFRCNCQKGCEGKRCKCVKGGRLCTSKCHNSSTCCNK